MTAIPKPERRVRDTEALKDAYARKLVVERECRSCGSVDELELHHLVYRSQGGDDHIDNLIPLCSTCHGLTHRGSPAGRGNVAQAIRASLSLRETAYCISRKSLTWLDSRYPKIETSSVTGPDGGDRGAARVSPEGEPVRSPGSPSSALRETR